MARFLVDLAPLQTSAQITRAQRVPRSLSEQSSGANFVRLLRALRLLQLSFHASNLLRLNSLCSKKNV